jgi:hypothetical protein
MRKVFNQAVCFVRRLFIKNKTSKKPLKHWSTEMPSSINNVEFEIKEDIIDIPECQENLNKFKDTFIKNEFVSFIGAGTSRLTGIPQWHDLIDELCKLANIQFDRENDDVPEKASKVKSMLKTQGKLNDYYRYLENKMKGISTRGLKFHAKVVDVFDKHITTNFDLKAYSHYIEKVSNSDCCQSIPNLNFSTFCDGKQPFAFLHGHIGCKFVILEKEIYDHYYPNASGEWGSKEIELFLYNVCRKFSIVFLGISFNDKYLFQTFRKIASDLAQDKDQKIVPRCHFLIVDENALNVGGFNLIDLKKQIERVDIESVRCKFLEKGYVDDRGNFKIEKFIEILEYRDPDQSVQMYLQDFGTAISTWFEKFRSMNVFPIVYKKDAHRFGENILSVVSKRGRM